MPTPLMGWKRLTLLLCLLIQSCYSLLVIDVPLGGIPLYDINQLHIPQNEPSVGEGYIVDLLYDQNIFNYCNLSLYTSKGKAKIDRKKRNHAVTNGIVYRYKTFAFRTQSAR